MARTTPESPRVAETDRLAAPFSITRPDPADAIRRDLLTLAGLPGQDRIRAIYGVTDAPAVASAA